MKLIAYIFCLLSIASSAVAESMINCHSLVSRLQVIEAGPDEASSKFVIVADRLVRGDDPNDLGIWIKGLRFSADNCLVQKDPKTGSNIVFAQCTVNVDSKPVRSYSLIKQQDGTFNFVDSYNPRSNNMTGLTCQ